MARPLLCSAVAFNFSCQIAGIEVATFLKGRTRGEQVIEK